MGIHKLRSQTRGEVIFEDTDFPLLMLNQLSVQINQSTTKRCLLATQKETYDFLNLLSKLTISKRQKCYLSMHLGDVAHSAGFLVLERRDFSGNLFLQKMKCLKQLLTNF